MLFLLLKYLVKYINVQPIVNNGTFYDVQASFRNKKG